MTCETSTEPDKDLVARLLVATGNAGLQGSATLTDVDGVGRRLTEIAAFVFLGFAKGNGVRFCSVTNALQRYLSVSLEMEHVR
ncbi:hypothetical protein CEXT_264341 [Caerostris extrusa]|uniref:Uncharacterized protein n=1 Tax=Caerostris extrusa TaxID=172846 RepID=A0AAV4P406_CAEEX|nr:hypothetical protein CEXT_264341 [Caerostris extrusa]